MKKLLSVLLVVVLLVTAMPLGAFNITVSAATSGYYTYSVSGGKATITDVAASISGNVTIPSTLGGYTVTSIGERAFENCSSLTSVTIPNSVTSIDSYAFYKCSNLTSITIPDSVISIGYRAFISCSKLTSITIPDSVTSIGERAFEYCSKLTSITIPDSVTSIGDYAFYDCSSLKEVHITDIAAWCNIDFNEYYSNPLYYAKNLYLNGELVTDLVIPNGVTSIGDSAFSDCFSLTSIIIPDSVTSIGDSAFSDCFSLTSVSLGDSVTSIGEDAFYNCIALANVYYNGSKASKNEIAVGSYNSRLLMAVWHCLDGDYIVNAGITSTGYTGYCTWTLDGTILTISGNGATDDYCTWYEWEEMENLWVTYVDEILPTPWGTLISDVIIEGNVSVGAYAFNGCEINTITLKNENIRFSSWGVGGSIYEVIIPDGIKSIESSLIPSNTFKKTTISNSVTSIGEYAFSSCSSLTSITIPNSVTSIGDEAFYGCSSLTSVSLGNSVTSIGDAAFIYCTSLKDVWYYGSEIDKSNITIGSNNSYLTDATWHYLCKEQHEYDSACDGACNNCEYERMPPHNFDNACDVSCNDCGIIRVTNHFYTNECDRDCNGCGEFRKSLHKFDNACDDTCNLCGTEREVDDHVYSSICDISCDECGATRINVVHTYNNECDAECNVCGFVRVEPHLYDNSCDAICNDCGYERTPEPHKIENDSYAFENATNYPFLLSGNVYSSTNKTHGSSATATITAKENGSITIKYYTSTEANYDKLIIKHNNTTVVTASGNTNWTSVTISVVAGDKIYITYSKDSYGSSGSDLVKFELGQNCEYSLVCSVCNEVLKNAGHHVYDDDCDTTCNECGFIRTVSHVYGNICDLDCNACGLIRTVEHIFTNECDNECDICYDSRKAPHAYDNACDAECNLCGKKRTVPGHTYGDDLVCDECGHKKFVLGDIDGTGVVDLSDVADLSKYLSGWSTECNSSALDVNDDGEVNLKDLVLLAQYVAGWEGITLH